MQIISIRKVGRKPVYDLSVEEVEHYILKNGVVTHNTGIIYSANTIFIITKAQEKDGDSLSGWKFTINIEKSRFVKEKSKLPFTVTYADGIKKYSAIFDLAVEAKFIVKATAQTWSQVDPATGEILPPKKTKTIENDDAYFEKLLRNVDFKEFVKNKYMLSTISDDNTVFSDEED